MIIVESLEVAAVIRAYSTVQSDKASRCLNRLLILDCRIRVSDVVDNGRLRRIVIVGGPGMCCLRNVDNRLDLRAEMARYRHQALLSSVCGRSRILWSGCNQRDMDMHQDSCGTNPRAIYDSKSASMGAFPGYMPP
ncbi:hypothetical protein MRB53_038948 [Persea americana]|nr:hypothetical protein MRB53_038948 [Persea americana]